jgi:iron-sulfur cluster repair protein YtfE (RIC family)
MQLENEVLFPKITKENVDKFKEAIDTMYKVKTFKK